MEDLCQRIERAALLRAVCILALHFFVKDWSGVKICTKFSQQDCPYDILYFYINMACPLAGRFCFIENRIGKSRTYRINLEKVLYDPKPYALQNAYI